MRTKKNKVRLTEGDRERLKEIINKGTESTRVIKHAGILLNLDENTVKVKTQEEIAQIFQCNVALIHTIAEQYNEFGIEQVITRKKRETPPVPLKYTGEVITPREE